MDKAIYYIVMLILIGFAACWELNDRDLVQVKIENNVYNSDYATQKYADKHGQIYALQPCECVGGVAPSGCGHLLPITKTDRPNKGEVLYFALDKAARIDTVWIEQATGLDCENYELWQMVKQ